MNKTDLQSSTILITGASSGIGRAVARRFAQSGMRIVVSARRIDRLLSLRDEIGDNCLPIEMDLADVETARGIISDLPTPFSNIAVLVNSAGVGLGDGRSHEVPWEDWYKTIATNVLGLAGIVHAVLPDMVRRGYGDIINLGSVAGTYPYPQGHVYGASKAFSRQFILNLRADLAGTGVRAMSIEPGTVKTEFAAVRMNHDAERLEAFYGGGRRLLQAEDIAEIIHFVVSLPRHVNVNSLEVMPTDQSFSFFRFVGED